ncbi:MAG: PD-(D/E)XK nuclease family protein, partial [Myxococcota bacterium]
GWPGEASDVGVLGAEVDGFVALQDTSGEEREIRFRADRVDQMVEGLRLIDYKTGKASANQQGAAYRRKTLLNEVSRGTALQAAAYAMCGSQIEKDLSAGGRYLYLGVDTPEHARVAEIDSGDHEFSDAFTRAVQVVFEAWDRGSFTPRLIDSSGRKEPFRCSTCSVKEACLRGDSGSRNRLAQWVESARTADTTKQLEAERAAIRLWDLGAEKA